ncbi:MAG: fatty acid desaturase [Rhodobacteraceae bacterium]|nr:fatty acid desaturase [Paracoccaceae bacterium]MCY4137434.1 fatty acid desaturase [Paracoccaceae bacterium]
MYNADVTRLREVDVAGDSIQKGMSSITMTDDLGSVLEPSFGHALPYFASIAVFPLLACAASYGGWWLAGPFVFFWLCDHFDTALGTDESNMNPGQANSSRLVWYKLAVWIWVALYPVTFVYVFWQIFVVGHLAIWETVLIVLALGAMARMTLNAGHDMMHRRKMWERCVGEILMASASFAQEVTEHIYIHHAHVGTPKDSLTPRKGLSFWRYLPRSVARSYVDAWCFERDRMARRRLPVWHPTNPIWRYVLETAAWYALAYWIGGAWGILVLIAVCAMGILQLRMADYIQHYGLQRIRTPEGRYERVQTRHSWTAAFKLSNWLYYNSQRHADHHITASRLYPVLQHCGVDDSPQLPGSYGTMGSLVMLPRRWFAKMDPLVDQWRARCYPQIDDWAVYDSAAYWSRPDDFDAIAEVFDASSFLAAHINRSPELLDSIRSREFTDLDLPNEYKTDPDFDTIAQRGLVRVYWTHELDSAEMLARIDGIPVQTVPEAVDVARNWSNNKVFQVCMHTLRGNLSPIEAGTALVNIAEASIASVLWIVDLVHADGRGGGGLAVAILGDLANGNAMPDAELDVMLVYEGNQANHVIPQFRQIDAALRALTRDSLLFAPFQRDRKMRNACSLEEFSERHRTAGTAAELLDLTRLRQVQIYGDSRTRERFEKARREALTHGASRDALITDLREMRASANQSDPLSIDDIQGGHEEVERTARYLQLVHAADTPEILTSDAMSIFRTAGTNGRIAAGTAEHLLEAATLWRNLRGIVRMIGKDKLSLQTANRQAKAVIARSCGSDDIGSLTDAVRPMATRTAASIAEAIGS